jgi:hypothetical protein
MVAAAAIAVAANASRKAPVSAISPARSARAAVGPSSAGPPTPPIVPAHTTTLSAKPRRFGG